MPNNVKGHALREDGAPFGRTPGGFFFRVSSYDSPNGIGLAVCECGISSAMKLPSSLDRRDWHREHKNEVLFG